MSQDNNSKVEELEKPLDPAVERVQRKLKRLLAVSSFTMLLGFVAVLAAIVYKLNTADDEKQTVFSVPDVVTDANLRRLSYDLPDGTQIVSSVVKDDDLIITYSSESGGGVVVVHLPSWQVHSVASF